jgi:hypothetical protein
MKTVDKTRSVRAGKLMCPDWARSNSLTFVKGKYAKGKKTTKKKSRKN